MAEEMIKEILKHRILNAAIKAWKEGDFLSAFLLFCIYAFPPRFASGSASNQ
jgi:hypothetical protein